MEEILKAGERLEDIAENNPQAIDSVEKVPDKETDKDSDSDNSDTEEKKAN